MTCRYQTRVPCTYQRPPNSEHRGYYCLIGAECPFGHGDEASVARETLCTYCETGPCDAAAMRRCIQAHFDAGTEWPGDGRSDNPSSDANE